MKLLNSPRTEHFDLAIIGLGYESRSTFAYKKYKSVIDDCVALGYESNQDVLHYQDNKKHFAMLRFLNRAAQKLLIT